MLIRLVLLISILAALLPARVKTGLDVLVEQDFAPVSGKRAGVIANQNSVTWDHRNIVDVMAASHHVHLAAIFAPEHGFSAANSRRRRHRIREGEGNRSAHPQPV